MIMSFTVDGKRYKTKWKIKYGQTFPKLYESRKVVIKGFGLCNIYVAKIDRPEWGKDLAVYVPIDYYITEIIKPDQEYLENSNVKICHKKPQLRLIK